MTGSPRDLASKLSLSERTVYNYIAFMREELKASIVYNYQKESYVYTDNWSFKYKRDFKFPFG